MPGAISVASGISLSYAVGMAKKQAKVDPWLALVLKTMSVEELRQAIAEETRELELAALKAELSRREGK